MLHSLSSLGSDKVKRGKKVIQSLDRIIICELKALLLVKSIQRTNKKYLFQKKLFLKTLAAISGEVPNYEKRIGKRII